MKANFTQSNRKDLVAAIEKIVKMKAVYKKAPTFAYAVNNFIINKDGTVTCSDDEALELLIESLAFEGFLTDEAMEGNLSISLPSISDEAMANLNSMVDAKRELLQQALQVDDLPIIQEDGRITFPWFKSLGPDETNAYTLLLTKMSEMAKNQKRVSAKQKEIVNAKYEFRCFLLRLGFIGDEYKGARKILLKNLSGSAAFKSK